MVIYQSIVTAFWSLWKCICRLTKINSSPSDSIFWISLTLRRSLLSDEDKLIQTRYRRRLADATSICNIAFTCVKVPMNQLSVSYRQTCSVVQHLRSRKVHEKRLVIMVTCIHAYSVNSLAQHCQQRSKLAGFGLLTGRHQTCALFRTFGKNYTIVRRLGKEMWFSCLRVKVYKEWIKQSNTTILLLLLLCSYTVEGS